MYDYRRLLYNTSIHNTVRGLKNFTLLDNPPRTIWCSPPLQQQRAIPVLPLRSQETRHHLPPSLRLLRCPHAPHWIDLSQPLRRQYLPIPSHQ